MIYGLMGYADRKHVKCSTRYNREPPNPSGTDEVPEASLFTTRGIPVPAAQWPFGETSWAGGRPLKDIFQGIAPPPGLWQTRDACLEKGC